MKNCQRWGKSANLKPQTLTEALDLLDFSAFFRFATKLRFRYNNAYFRAPVLNLHLRELQQF